MARKSGSTISQEELYPADAERAYAQAPREELDDARLVDLDVDEQSPFLRAQKRIPARRGSIPKKAVNRLLWGAVAAGCLCVAAIAAGSVYRYGERSWRFRVESSDGIEITGMKNVTKAQIMEVMGADIGRNIFFIPLAQQKAQLEQIPWVQSASVMRFAPNRLKVEIHERAPVAFARVGPRIELIDAGGTLMEVPPKHKYSFPVILGMNPGEPLSTRAPRMKAYMELTLALDSEGAHYSQELSEVDLSELDNLKVRVNDPAGDVLVQLGSSDYLKRYKTYVSHAQEWRQQFQKLESVNLRYDNQVIVNPDLPPTPKRATLTPAAAKAAAAAGVKPAALITRIPPHDHGVPKPVFELPESKLNPNSSETKKLLAKIRTRKAVPHGRRVTAAKKPVPQGKSFSAGRAKKPNGGQANSAGKVPPKSTVAAGSASAPVATRIPKPSPAIARQQANSNSSSN